MFIKIELSEKALERKNGDKNVSKSDLIARSTYYLGIIMASIFSGICFFYSLLIISLVRRSSCCIFASK